MCQRIMMNEFIRSCYQFDIETIYINLMGMLMFGLCLISPGAPKLGADFPQENIAFIVLTPGFIILIVGDHTKHIVTARSIHQKHLRARGVYGALFGGDLNCSGNRLQRFVIPVDSGQIPVHIFAGPGGDCLILMN